MKTDDRTLEQIAEHYAIEKRLAAKLRNASREDRQGLYPCLYDELFRRLRHHPQVRRAASSQEASKSVSFQIRNIRSFLRKDYVFLELGAGDCALSIEVARFVDKVFAVDVTEKNIVHSRLPENCKFVLSNGYNIPVDANSVDIAYSYQLMEHLHPDDAAEQLRNVYNTLTPGGIYVCDTPNRLSGPHDISGHFDRVATGFHLKEYTVSELSRLFRVVGFSKIRMHTRVKQIHLSLPIFMGRVCEVPLEHFPYTARKKIAGTWPLSLFLGIRLIGTK